MGCSCGVPVTLYWAACGNAPYSLICSVGVFVCLFGFSHVLDEINKGKIDNKNLFLIHLRRGRKKEIKGQVSVRQTLCTRQWKLLLCCSFTFVLGLLVNKRQHC